MCQRHPDVRTSHNACTSKATAQGFQPLSASIVAMCPAKPSSTPQQALFHVTRPHGRPLHEGDDLHALLLVWGTSCQPLHTAPLVLLTAAFPSLGGLKTRPRCTNVVPIGMGFVPDFCLSRDSLVCGPLHLHAQMRRAGWAGGYHRAPWSDGAACGSGSSNASTTRCSRCAPQHLQARCDAWHVTAHTLCVRSCCSRGT